MTRAAREYLAVARLVVAMVEKLRASRVDPQPPSWVLYAWLKWDAARLNTAVRVEGPDYEDVLGKAADVAVTAAMIADRERRYT